MIQQFHSWVFIQKNHKKHKTKNTKYKRYMHPYVIAALLFHIIAKIQKQPKCPSMDEWIKKMWYKYTHGVLLRHKKE